MGVIEVYKENKVSKAGNPYELLHVIFENGYDLQVFLNNEQKIILADVPQK